CSSVASGSAAAGADRQHRREHGAGCAARVAARQWLYGSAFSREGKGSPEGLSVLVRSDPQAPAREISLPGDIYILQKFVEFTERQRLRSIDQRFPGVGMTIDQDHVGAGDDTLRGGV